MVFYKIWYPKSFPMYDMAICPFQEKVAATTSRTNSPDGDAPKLLTPLTSADLEDPFLSATTPGDIPVADLPFPASGKRFSAINPGIKPS